MCNQCLALFKSLLSRGQVYCLSSIPSLVDDMQLQALVLLSLVLSIFSGHVSGGTPLYFSFVVSFGHHGFDSSGLIPAVDLALEHINNRSNVLDGLKLTYLSFQDSKVWVTYIYIYIYYM